MAAQTHEEILKTFRETLFAEGILHEGDTIGTDDETLLRFLRARKTVNGTGLDKLYSEMDPFDVRLSLSIHYSCGEVQSRVVQYPEREAVFDCWPLYFHKTGQDFPKLYKTCTPERHWESVIVNAGEVLPASSRLAGRPVGTVLVIVDLKGFSLSKFWQMKNLARSSFQISQDYFPETMGQLAIVNAPSSFTFIWSIMRPWMAKETAEKVDILGHDYRQRLLDMVDADSLPKTLGGNCECEGGCHLSSVGPWLDGRVGWGPKSKAKIADKDTSTTSADTTEIPEPNGVSEKEDSLDVDPGFAEPNGRRSTRS
ncbi:CRAL TRIO domain-containing protein [Mycena olivaceomarginata]|nr:CRAL TRIO domain-containing protein [Mycena olivaceomarginata]